MYGIIIIAIACAFGMIYGIARGNSMIIGQTSALAALDTSIICLTIIRDCQNILEKGLYPIYL